MTKRAITRIAPTAQPVDFGRGEPCVRPKMAETMIKAWAYRVQEGDAAREGAAVAPNQFTGRGS